MVQTTGKAYQVNVTSAEAVDKAVADIVKEFNGRLDVFVANSGIPWTKGAFIDGPADMARDVMSVNVDGVMWCAKSAGAHFRRQKEEGTTIDGKPLENYTTGSFIATASMSGSIVNIPQLQAVYNGSKAAVIHFCMSPGSMMALRAAQKANKICFRQEFGRRVGWICPSQHRVPRIYPDRDLVLCAYGDQDGVEGQDCYGVC